MKENKKVINEKNYNKTKRGSKERLKRIGKGNIVLSENDKEIKREAYRNDESVFNPDNPNSMKIATVRARRVIPYHRQRNLPEHKLNEIRLILIVDTIRDNVLYLNLTKYKEGHEANEKYLIVDAILNNKMKQTVDLVMDNLDYSYRRQGHMNISRIRIQFNIKLSNKTKRDIYRAVNARLSNINLSRRLKNIQ